MVRKEKIVQSSIWLESLFALPVVCGVVATIKKGLSIWDFLFIVVITCLITFVIAMNSKSEV